MPGAGNYRARVSAEGHETKIFPFTIPQRKYGKWVRQWTQQFVLNQANKIHTVQLGEAVVKATRIKMVMKGDTVVYNADAFNLSNGSMLDALIKALPGMKIDAQGQITHNGEKVEELLVNGKEFFKGNPKIALDNLPAYTVNQLKVYRKAPKDAYLRKDTTAVKWQRKLVVDVMLKRQYNQGWLANAEGAVGTHNRFLARLFAMRYTDHSKLYLFGNVNNMNSDAAPGSNGNWDTYRNETGTMTTQSGGLNFNVDNKNTKLSYDASINATHRNRLNETAVSSVQYLSGGDNYGRNYTRSRDRSTMLNVIQGLEQMQAGFYWKVSGNFVMVNGKGRNMTRGATFGYDPADAYRGASLDSIFAPMGSRRLQQMLIHRMLNDSYSEYNNANLSVSSFLSYKTPLLGNNGVTTMNFYLNDQHNHAYSLSDLRYAQTGATDYRHQFTRTPSKEHRLQFSQNYNWSFSRFQKTHYNVQYEFTSNFRRGHRDLFRLDSLEKGRSIDNRNLIALPSTTDSLHAVQDWRNSYHTVNRDNTHVAVLSLDVDLKNGYAMSFSSKVNFRHASISDERNANPQRLSRDLTSLEPTVSFGRIAQGRNITMFRLSYQMSTEMPALSNMLNVKDDSNPLVVQLGNENLKNTRVHNAQIWLTTARERLNRNFSVSSYWYANTNSVGQAMTYDRTTGKTTYQPRNINGNWSSHSEVYYGQALDTLARWLYSAQVAVEYSNSADFFTEVGAASSGPYRSSVHNFSLTPNLRFVAKIKKAELTAMGELTWRRITSSRTNFNNINSYEYKYGLNCRTPLLWGFEFNSDITMYSRRGYSDASMNDDNLVWNAELTRSFFKDKTLTLKLDAFDLLGQLDNVRTEVNPQGRTETWTNTFPRYVMFHAIYRLNLLPKTRKEKR
jgi:hypothetical protein